jgi:hypothetical protein
MPRMPPRLFTVDEADRLVPTLGPLLRALAAKKAELLAKQTELLRLLEAASRPGDAARVATLLRGKEELKFIAEEFNVSLHEVSRLGCLVKDVDAGLVDFPAVREGREVFLCWRLGEPRVAHWHGIEEGFAGRKPLEGDQVPDAAWEGSADPEPAAAGAEAGDGDSPTIH